MVSFSFRVLRVCLSVSLFLSSVIVTEATSGNGTKSQPRVESAGTDAQKNSSRMTPGTANEKVETETSNTLDNSSLSGTSSIVSPTSIRSGEADSVDEIFAAVQQHWEDPLPGSTLSDSNSNQEMLTRVENPLLIRSMGQMLISLAFVILLGLSVAWLFKRFMGTKHTLGGGYIEKMGSYALSQKSNVHLIRVGGNLYLVGEGATSLSLIAKVDLNHDSLSLPDEIEEALAGGLNADSSADSLSPQTSFPQHLSQWQNSLGNRNLRQEMNASLVFLKGLTQRLRSKGERNA